MKWIGHIFFIFLYFLVTFFGLGPVLMADGVWQERTITAIVVVIIYGILSFLYKKFITWTTKKL